MNPMRSDPNTRLTTQCPCHASYCSDAVFGSRCYAAYTLCLLQALAGLLMERGMLRYETRAATPGRPAVMVVQVTDQVGMPIVIIR